MASVTSCSTATGFLSGRLAQYPALVRLKLGGHELLDDGYDNVSDRFARDDIMCGMAK